MGNSRIMTAIFAGAAIGGVVGYLFYTAHGRHVRREIEATIDDVARELISFRTTAQKVARVASESWQGVKESVGESGSAPRDAGRQT
jgi:gas vesicle protein